MQEEGRFTLAQITPNVSDCIPLINWQYVRALNIYQCRDLVALLISTWLAHPSFISMDQNSDSGVEALHSFHAYSCLDVGITSVWWFCSITHLSLVSTSCQESSNSEDLCGSELSGD